MTGAAWQTVNLPLTQRQLPDRDVLDIWLCNSEALPLDSATDSSNRRQELRRRRLHQQFLLRLLLGSYLGCAGKDIRLTRGQHGKPVLDRRAHANLLEFNLSHSGDWLAVAIGTGAEVGIDIEVHRTLRRAGDLARRYLPAPEADWLSGLQEPERSRAFICQWTAREALVKARGSSLAQSVAGLALDWLPARIAALPSGWPEPAQWSLIAPEVPADLSLHVATPQPGLGVRLFFLDLKR